MEHGSGRARRELTADEIAWLSGKDVAEPTPLAPPRASRTSRRGLLLGTLGVGAAGASAWALSGAGDAPAIDALSGGGLPGSGSGADDGPHATCADPSTLKKAGRIGSAALVYEIDERPRPMSFDAGFHAQLSAWLADWNATSRHGGVKQIWSYGAWVAKDECHSWHANGRAFDIAHLMAGDDVLVSCRTDLWGQVAPARRRALEKGYWALAASLHLHFAHVLTHHFDELHRNHIHVDNGISGAGMSSFDPSPRVQNQAVQAICASLWVQDGAVTGEWSDTRRQVAPVLSRLGVTDLRRQKTWQSFLRSSVRRG